MKIIINENQYRQIIESESNERLLEISVDEFLSAENVIIRQYKKRGYEGIKLFDDMLTANSRLIDSGYDVKMDLNSNHGQYKPVKFLIYFNI